MCHMCSTVTFIVYTIELRWGQMNLMIILNIIKRVAKIGQLKTFKIQIAKFKYISVMIIQEKKN